MNLQSIHSCLRSKLTSGTKEAKKETKEDLLIGWERHFSGKPTNCMQAQFLFSGDVKIETPEKVIGSFSRFWGYCEESWQKKYQQVEIFRTSPYYWLNNSTVSFTRTILYLNEFNCRMSSHGITTLEFNDLPKINKWREFYDLEDFKKQNKACSLEFDSPTNSSTTLPRTEL